MAGLRRAIELAIGEEDLAACARSRGRERNRRAGSSGRGCCWPIGKTRRSLRWVALWGCIIRPSSAASSGRWPMVAMAALDDRAAAGQGADDHGRGQGMAGGSGLSQGEGPGLSARIVDDAAAGSPRARAWPGGGACLPGKLAQGTVCKILNEQEVKPHKVRYYLERRDPEFKQKMAEVLCVYREVAILKESAAAAKTEPSDAVAIVSYDEKPGIQAIATTAPDLPPEPGALCDLRARPRVQAPRHGQPAGWHRSAHRPSPCPGQGSPPQPRIHRIPQAARCRLSEPYRDQADPRQSFRAHLQGDQGLARRAADGRFEFTFTPKHGSWLNLVEGFFSKLARSVLRHIRVASKQELKDRIMAAMDDFNRHPVVHTWSYKLDQAA